MYPNKKQLEEAAKMLFPPGAEDVELLTNTDPVSGYLRGLPWFSFTLFVGNDKKETKFLVLCSCFNWLPCEVVTIVKL